MIENQRFAAWSTTACPAPAVCAPRGRNEAPGKWPPPAPYRGARSHRVQLWEASQGFGGRNHKFGLRGPGGRA